MGSARRLRRKRAKPVEDSETHDDEERDNLDDLVVRAADRQADGEVSATTKWKRKSQEAEADAGASSSKAKSAPAEAEDEQVAAANLVDDARADQDARDGKHVEEQRPLGRLLERRVGDDRVDDLEQGVEVSSFR